MSTTRNIIEGIKNVTSDVSATLNTKANQSTTYTKTEVDSKPTGFKNYIINGNFDVWQRGDGSFTGWNRSCDMNISPDTTVQSKYVDNTYGNCILCTGNSTADAVLYSAIELTTVGNNSQFTVGKTFTFSVLIKSNIKVKPFFVFRDGIAGANPVNLFDFTSIAYKGGNNVWELLSWTFTVSGNTTSLNNCLAYGLIGETANGTSYIAQVQLEEGSVATPFEQRPYGLELSLCQRHLPLNIKAGYYGSYGSGYVAIGSTTAATITIPFATTSRSLVYSLLTNGNFDLVVGNATFTVTSFSIDTNNTDSRVLSLGVFCSGGGLTGGSACTLRSANSPGSYILVSNEL